MNANRILQIAGLALIIVVSAVAGAQLQGCWSSDPAPQVVRTERSAPDTTDRTGRTLAPRDTVREVVTRPEERVVYETRVDTVRACYTRPTDFVAQGLVDQDPIQVERRLFDDTEVTLTYFQPSASRFEQQVYDVPAPKWEMWPSLDIRTDPTGGLLFAGAQGHVRWRQLEASAGYYIGHVQNSGPALHGPVVALKWRPFTLRW